MMENKPRKYYLASCLALAVLLSSALPCEAFTKKGTTAADFLKIGVGGRPVAMAGSVVACPTNLDALYWNPAGLAGADKVQLGATHARWIASINYDFLGLVVPAGHNLTIGAFAASLSTEEMEQTTISQPEGTGILFDYGDITGGVAAGLRLTDRFRVGAAVKVVYTKAFNESATAVALDVGTHLVTAFHGLSIGMALANFGTNMKLDGRDLIVEGDPEPNMPGNENREARLETNEYPLPVTFRIGVALDLLGVKPALMISPHHRITTALSADHFAENVEQLHGGAEYAFREMFFLRGGYTVNDDSRSWAAGAGVAVASGNVRVRADFAYEDMGVFDMVPRFSLALEF
jgi:hypothetical protein